MDHNINVRILYALNFTYLLNLWEIVKGRISILKPTTKTQFIECLISVWRHDPGIKDMCPKLVRGMAKRVKLVHKVKGIRHSKY